MSPMQDNKFSHGTRVRPSPKGLAEWSYLTPEFRGTVIPEGGNFVRVRWDSHCPTVTKDGTNLMFPDEIEVDE